MLGGTGNVKETLASVVLEFMGNENAESRRGAAGTGSALPVEVFTPWAMRAAVRRGGSLKEEIRIARR